MHSSFSGPFVWTQSIQFHLLLKPVITLEEQDPNAINAPTNNKIIFHLLNLIIPLPFPAPAAPTAGVMARTVVARTMRAAPTMRFLLEPILQLASRNSTTNHS